MQDFYAFMHNLPKPLDSELQKELLIKFFETKNEEVRQTLLEHNLRLCAQCAINYCKSHNCEYFVFDAFNENFIALYKVLEEYNPYHASNQSFSNYAWNSMVRKTSRANQSNIKEYQNLLDPIIFDDYGEESEDDVFMFLYDPSESNFPEDIINKEFIKDILNQVSTQNLEIFKKYWGIGYPNSYSTLELAQEQHCTAEGIRQKLIKEAFAIRKHISINYPVSYPDLCRDFKTQSGIFAKNNLLERDKYLTYSYYGIDSYTQKPESQLASEFGIAQTTVRMAIERYIAKLPAEEQQRIKSEAKPPIKMYKGKKLDNQSSPFATEAERE